MMKDNEKLAEAMRVLKQKLRNRKELMNKKPKRILMKQPRYDDVYHEGMKWLDSL